MTDFSDAWEQFFGEGTCAPSEPRTLRPEDAKPTQYGGITFRSALEASWAQTLSSLGVQWDYEPKLISLPSGANYLPDFRLPDIGAWLEVKGTNVPRIEKAVEFAQMLACDCSSIQECECRWRGGEIVIIGHPPLVSQHPVTYRTSWWMNWGQARRGNGWFIKRCEHCNVSGWTTSPDCRACGKFLTRGLIAPADRELRMERW